MKRAAHFILWPELATSPPNEALVSALLDNGYAVDIYTPWPAPDVSRYGGDVRCLPVHYGNRWLLRNIASLRWRRYDLLSATAEDPFAIVGVLARAHGRKTVFLVDEIKSGSYAGNATKRWKRVCIKAIREAAFCIVNDESRIPLLQSYAGIADAGRVIVYPGCYRDPPAAVEREAVRRGWRVADGDVALGVSGGFNEMSGAEWLLETFCGNSSLRLVVQAPGLSKFDRVLLSRIEGHQRLYVEPGRLGWREAWAAAVGIDVGLAIYLNPAPQFQNMGTSSNRLCMYLAMGVPVIASRQPSFRFLEDYDCGIMVDDAKSFALAVDRIAARLPEMRANALRCRREYIRAPERYSALRDRIAGLVR
jgi:glycosyltransferase involved in cell wall biosynthesis